MMGSTTLSRNRTGRSDLGNLRNFGAMGSTKFNSVYAAVMRERNDPEAMYQVQRWARMKEMVEVTGIRPDDCSEEDWYLLQKLAGVV